MVACFVSLLHIIYMSLNQFNIFGTMSKVLEFTCIVSFIFIYIKCSDPANRKPSHSRILLPWYLKVNVLPFDRSLCLFYHLILSCFWQETLLSLGLGLLPDQYPYPNSGLFHDLLFPNYAAYSTPLNKECSFKPVPLTRSMTSHISHLWNQFSGQSLAFNDTMGAYLFLLMSSQTQDWQSSN